MNNQVICNPKTEVAKGLVLTDKDYIEGLLTVCKDLEKNLTVALTEASHEELYDEIFEMFKDISLLQRETYELWFRKGWFEIEPETKEKINEKYDKLNQEYRDLEEDSVDDNTLKEEYEYEEEIDNSTTEEDNEYSDEEEIAEE